MFIRPGKGSCHVQSQAISMRLWLVSCNDLVVSEVVNTFLCGTLILIFWLLPSYDTRISDSMYYAKDMRVFLVPIPFSLVVVESGGSRRCICSYVLTFAARQVLITSIDTIAIIPAHVCVRGRTSDNRQQWNSFSCRYLIGSFCQILVHYRVPYLVLS